MVLKNVSLSLTVRYKWENRVRGKFREWAEFTKVYFGPSPECFVQGCKSLGALLGVENREFSRSLSLYVCWALLSEREECAKKIIVSFKSSRIFFYLIISFLANGSAANASWLLNDFFTHQLSLENCCFPPTSEIKTRSAFTWCSKEQTSPLIKTAKFKRHGQWNLNKHHRSCKVN